MLAIQRWVIADISGAELIASPCTVTVSWLGLCKIRYVAARRVSMVNISRLNSSERQGTIHPFVRSLAINLAEASLLIGTLVLVNIYIYFIESYVCMV